MATKAQKTGSWVYRYDTRYPAKWETTSVRYVLGEVWNPKVKKALVCVGLNPSTAVPEALDFTLGRVAEYAKRHKEYGAWYMVNIYPQRATDPDDMHTEPLAEIVAENLHQIQELMRSLDEADVWCAWGSTIKKPRFGFLRELLCVQGGVLDALRANNAAFKASGITADGYPKHPRVLTHGDNLFAAQIAPNGKITKQ